MEFRILGPLEALEEGRVVRLGGSKQRALLAVLLLHANETLSIDRLIDELWGERPPATAAKTVQVYISRLRKALAGGVGDASGGVVLSREHGYELALDRERLDAHRFERLVTQGREELAKGDPELAVSRLEGALSLWRGRPLADLTYEPFAQREIGRLDDLRVMALEQLTEAKLALGRHADVVGQLEELIAEHPYRERLRAQLMLALYRSDRQADALQAYQDARRRLVEELGIEPGERLRELERAILAQDPGLHLAAAEQAAGELAVEGPRGAFVGRERELAELAGGLDDAFAGRGCLFLLVGEPGIGKSRLADELIAHARARGARILVGRCWEAGGAPAYWPWVQSLRAYVRAAAPDALRAQLGAGAAQVAQILPELRRRFHDLPEPSSAEPEAARFRLFDATAEFLRSACERQPTVLVLDDLHAADAPSLLLLQFLVRELRSTRMLLLGAYRDVDPIPGQLLTDTLAEIAREPATRRLVLGGLSEAQVADYVELAASEIASAQLAATLHDETEGNPLFVGEIVRLLAVEGVPPDSTRAPSLAIPQSLRDVIARRLSHLSEGCRQMLVLASVIGREFPLAALAHMGRVSDDRLLDTLDEAMAARVVADVPGARDRLRFAHVLIRDTLYDGLTRGRRIRLHRLAVDTLGALYGSDPGTHLAELAHHAIAGHDFATGLRYAQRAGDRALALLAYEEAGRLYETALDALDMTDRRDDGIRCELLISLGEAEMRAGNAPAARKAFVDAAAVARRRRLPRELARAAAGYGGRIVWARAGADDRLVPLLEEGLAALADEDVELRARLLARLAGALRDEHRRDRRDALSSQAVELARRTGNPAALAYALDGRGAAIAAPDTVAECLAIGDELRRVAAQNGDTERVLAAHFHRFIAHVTIADIAAAHADLGMMIRIADELKQPAQLWLVRAQQATLALAAGRLTEAEALAHQALALGERALADLAIGAYQLQLYALCDFRGGFEEVGPAIRGLAEKHRARPIFRCALAHLYTRLGRTEDARREFEELARDDFSALPLDQEWLYGMSLLAETCAVLSDRDSAVLLHHMLLPYEAFNAADVPEGIRGSVSRYLGILATADKSWDLAEQHFETGLAMNSEMGVRPWLAHTQHDYARMLLSRAHSSDRERARNLLHQAQVIYHELGMDDHAAGASAPARTDPRAS